MSKTTRLPTVLPLLLLLLLLLPPLAARASAHAALAARGADPLCARGIAFNGACCAAKCGRCGGTGCWVRGVYLQTTCCADKIVRDKPSCNHAAAPCVVPRVPLPRAPPPPPPPPSNDPACAGGIAFNGACCAAKCGRCGGTGCWVRGVYLQTTCCADKIVRDMPSCWVAKPPCRLSVRRQLLSRPERPAINLSASVAVAAAINVPTAARMADPRCAAGIAARGACCPRVCGQCGGAGCFQRSLATGQICCADKVKRERPFCFAAAAPCKLAAAAPPPPPALRAPFFNNAFVSRGALLQRHEACALMVNQQVVLLGGRGVNKRVSIYNPKTGVWSNHPGPGAGVEIHHMQCVAAAGKVWIVSSWTGRFPFEKNNALIYVYDVGTRSWSTRAGLPEYRRRGGAAAVRRGDWIYVVGGNRGGHGAHATSLRWMDAYNFVSDKWALNLPSLPAGAQRDHVGGGLVRDQLCVAGGRDGGSASFFTKNLRSTFCFNFGAWRWQRSADMPEPRAGAMTGAVCGDRLMVAGGEGNGRAYKRVDLFNGVAWQRGPDMTRARHGSGLAVAQCRCGQIFIPSGSGNQGGSPELLSTEKYNPPGTPSVCGVY